MKTIKYLIYIFTLIIVYNPIIGNEEYRINNNISKEELLNNDDEIHNIKMIYYYYKYGKLNNSLNLSKLFLFHYPYSKYNRYIYYLMGMIFYEYQINTIEYIFPYKCSKYDPSIYIKSFNYLKWSIMNDNNYEYIQDAKHRMVYLYNLIAKYEYNLSILSLNNKNYITAIIRANVIISFYQHSPYFFISLKLIDHANSDFLKYTSSP